MKEIVGLMIETAQKSCDNLRKDFSAIRYAKDFKSILFEFRGETFKAKVPLDVMPAFDCIGTDGEASRSWALKTYLNGDCEKVS